MKAVIPAAGEGKRFNKDSTYMHKCLVPINGKALLLYTLENLTNIKEITECIVIIGENHEKIIDTIGTKVNDTPILFCKQKQSVKGVVGAIESAVEEIGNDDFILVLADEFVYENNYAEAIEKELVDLLNLICATGKIQSFVVGNYYCNVNNMNDYLRIIEFLEGERNEK